MKFQCEDILRIERRMARQELTIPNIAGREFRKAHQYALNSGAQILIAKDGQLMRVSKAAGYEVVRTLDGSFGDFSRGTRLEITKTV